MKYRVFSTIAIEQAAVRMPELSDEVINYKVLQEFEARIAKALAWAEENTGKVSSGELLFGDPDASELLAILKGGVQGDSPDSPDGWISVDDRLPLQGVPVLCWDSCGMADVGTIETFDQNRQYQWWVGYRSDREFSYWMPLPKGPQP